MSFIVWSEDLSVGDNDIDLQHRRLLELTNVLHDAMLQKQGREAVEICLTDLVSYTQYHFSAEETKMIRCAAPDYSQHKREHEGFISKISTFQKEFESNQIGLSIELLNFLRDWIVHHIICTDKQVNYCER